MANEEKKYSYLNSILQDAEALWHAGNTIADYRKIISLYTEVIEIELDYKDTLERRAVAYREAKMYRDSILDFLQCFKLYPASSRYLRLAGEVQFMAEEYANALETLTRAIRMDTNDIFSREIRAKVFRILGKDLEAEADEFIVAEYNEAEQAKWDDPDHYYHYK